MFVDNLLILSSGSSFGSTLLDHFCIKSIQERLMLIQCQLIFFKDRLDGQKIAEIQQAAQRSQQTEDLLEMLLYSLIISP
jgi:hypothetical protein